MKVLRSIFVVGIIIMLSIYGVPPANAAPGDLDTTFAGFGTGGQVITSIPRPRDDSYTNGVVLQPDGKIVVAGTSNGSLLVMRYLPNGVLDTAFGTGGRLTSTLAGYYIAQTHAALQPDGSIVVAAAQRGIHLSTFLLARLTPNGALDTTFSGDGWVATDFGYDDGLFFFGSQAVLVQPDGKIVACGDGSDENFDVARYNADGSLDSTFDGDGKTSIDFGTPSFANCDAIALQSDGKLVLAGSSYGLLFNEDVSVARLNADGSPDNSFDGNGTLVTDLGGDNERAKAVAIQPDGKIVVAGDDTHTHALIARYLPNGNLDTSFDGDGKVSISGLSGGINAMQLQPDGKIVLIGYHESPNNTEDFALYRRTANGAPDLTFDGDGDAFIALNAQSGGDSLALQPDGRIIAYGYSGDNAVLVRLWPDASFDTGGKQMLGFNDLSLGPNTREGANAMALQSNGDIIVAGYVADAANINNNFGLARFLPNGQIDESFGTFGHVSFGFGGTEVATAVAIQPDDKIVVAGYTQTGSATTSNFMIARFNADGSGDGTFGFLGFNVLDFMGGADYAYSMALAPDGKIVVAGTVFNGARNVFGVARFNTDGTVDQSFDLDGKQLVEVTPNVTHAVKAVVVQPDGKIVLGGSVNRDFALVRLNDDGSVDDTFGNAGKTITDMGGDDTLTALTQTTSGEFYAAGSRYLNANNDFALAHYDANGVLLPCLRRCTTWPKTYVDFGGSDVALALDIHNDDQIFVAGCSNTLFAWAQLKASGTSVITTGTTAVAGGTACASGVKLVAPDKIVLAGTQIAGLDTNMALARFEVAPSTLGDTPISGLSATTDSPTMLGNATTLTASIASGTNVSYNWDFGDGTPTASGASVTHAYGLAGTFTAILTATNSQGSASATVQVEVDVAAIAPTSPPTDTAITGLDAIASSSTRLGDPTTFTATAASGTNITYNWDFGDGTPMVTGANVMHIYTVAGTFTVTLTATNAQSRESTTTQVQVAATSNEWRIYLPNILR